MTERRKLDKDSLRAVHLPEALTEELLEVDALCLERPAPTEELVRNTLERCEDALQTLQLAKQEAPTPWWRRFPRVSWQTEPAFSWQTEPVPEWAEFLGALNTCVAAAALPFARKNPQEPAVLVVDNHAVIDPELWGSDPSLVMLHSVYHGVGDALGTVTGRPIDRLVILKENPEAYDEKDLKVIHKAIEQPTTKHTYLVAAKDAGPLKERGCAVVAKEILFEIEKGHRPDSFVVKAPRGGPGPGGGDRDLPQCLRAETEGVSRLH